MQIELRPVRAFVEVVRRQGFSRAAEALFSTQSTVSKAVKQLEAELGSPLLDRSAPALKLTPVGEVVYRRGEKLLADRDDLIAEIAELRGLKRGTLRLGLPPIGSSTLFAPLFARYRRLYPDIAITLVEQGSDQLELALRTGDIDLAGLLQPVGGEFDCLPLMSEPLVALLRVDHPLAGCEQISMGQLAGADFILFDASFSLNRIVREICHRTEFDPNVVALSSQVDFVIELVAAGLGVAFLPRMIALQRAQADVRAVLLAEPGTEWRMSMAWRRDAYLSDATQAWLDLIRTR